MLYNFSLDELRQHPIFQNLDKAQRLSVFGQVKGHDIGGITFLERRGIIKTTWIMDNETWDTEIQVDLVPFVSRGVYWVLQIIGTGSFDMVMVNEGSNPLEGKFGYEVVSGPYLWISPAGKALALAVESYDEGSFDTWNKARQQLIDVVSGTIPANGIVPDWYALLEELELLIRDWDTS